jgi:hypothetical protein
MVAPEEHISGVTALNVDPCPSIVEIHEQVVREYACKGHDYYNEPVNLTDSEQ